MKNNQVKLVLNGGKKVLDSATVPVEWYFSKKVIKQSPKSIVFIDLTQKELNEGGKLLGCGGERHIFRIKDRNQFIQFNTHGSHKILVLVFSEDVKDKNLINSVHQKFFGNYQNTMFPNNIEELISGKKKQLDLGNRKVIAAEIIDIEIPEGLFADKPKSKFGKKVYEWVNDWHEIKEPRDECEYRNRKIFAFTLKPILWLIFSFLIRDVIWRLICCSIIFPFIVNIIGTLWRIITTIVLSLFGRYPIKETFSEFIEFWKEWDLDYKEQEDVFKFPIVSKYKVIAGKKYKLALWHVVLVIFVVWPTNFILTNPVGVGIWNIVLLMGILAIVSIISILVFLRLSKNIKGKTYEEWLMETSSIKSAPKSILAKDMKESYDRKILNSGKIRFWALKANVCKPFARN